MAPLALVATLLALAVFVAAFDEHHHCGTMDVYARNLARSGNNTQKTGPIGAAACPTEGTCDTPSVRDAAPFSPIVIRVVAHIFNSATGKPPNGVTASTVNDQIRQLNEDYDSYNIQFSLTNIYTHNDGNYYCLDAYGSNDNWYTQLMDLKTEYAVNPQSQLNIFITCQDQGSQGTLLGIGTFPWDPTALGATGGFWLNSATTGYGKRTASHELGHNLGLWHTFHGVSEVTPCKDPCYEPVHSPFDATADLIGDFCADTPATPINYNCATPAGTDCKTKSAWGNTAVNNIMSYSPDTCMNSFTNDQAARMHCWVCQKLSNAVISGC